MGVVELVRVRLDAEVLEDHHSLIHQVFDVQSLSEHEPADAQSY